MAARLGFWWMLSVALLLGGCAGAGQSRPPAFADVHTHYNWNQSEVTDPRQVTAAFERNNVTLAVVFSEPSEEALRIRSNGTTRVIHLFSPYIRPGIRPWWFRDRQVLEKARAGLASGRYAGIGEVHIGGPLFGPDDPVFSGLVKLAAEFDVPFLIHVNASRPDYIIGICRDHPTVRFLWAHAGGTHGPVRVRRALEACDNLWVELSARGPQHYGRLADTGPDGNTLRDGWLALIADYPDRFMTGTDPVEKAYDTYKWDQANHGWELYDELVEFHRRWLGQLPPALAERVRLTNAYRFFGVER